MVSFTEAMQFAYDNGTGLKDEKGQYKKAKAVSRPATSGKQRVHIYYDHTLFLGTTPFGFRGILNEDSEPSTYTPSMEGIVANDWELDTI